MAEPCSFHDLATLSEAQTMALLQRSETDLASYLERAGPIIEAVKREGDRALVRFGQELDKAQVTADTLRASEEEFDAASASSTGR